MLQKTKIEDGEPPLPAGPDDYGQTAAEAATPGTPPQPLKLTFFDENSSFATKGWILKGLIARGETSSCVAPPGAGKSALLTEISVHCAARIDWRGHKAKEACGVLILALERADLYRRRLQAYRQRDGLSDLPIAVAGDVIDLLSPSSVDLIVATVRRAELYFECAVGLIVIDTFAKGIAASGGDEDKARDQNRAAANLRKVHAALDVHIALVGHTGKDETRGARGSNAHLGDVDLMIQISGDAIKTAQVIKGNDQPERAIAEFRLEAFQLGSDQDGDPIVTSIVSADHAGAPQGARRKSRDKLRGKPLAGLRALNECVADADMPTPANEHVPTTAKGVTMTLWKERLEKTRLINPDGNPRQEFQRIHVTLKNAGAIGIWEDFVWPVT
jgi:hypothetical protein